MDGPAAHFWVLHQLVVETESKLYQAQTMAAELRNEDLPHEGILAIINLLETDLDRLWRHYSAATMVSEPAETSRPAQ